VSLEPNVLEEDIVVHTAECMLHGDHLYRDAIAHTGPLPYQLLVIAIDDRPAGGPRWRSVEADLSRFAGQRASLRLEFRAERSRGRDGLAWFDGPHIALRP
jgi:hypothetical protein